MRDTSERKPPAPVESDSELLDLAVQLLARREHSRQELVRKLAGRSDSPERLERVLDQLVERGYQSDQRCAEMLVRHRSLQGWGPRKIRQDLQQKGIASELCSQVLEAAEVDWFALALEQAHKKYGTTRAADYKERAKRTRFLVGRGFSYDEVSYALEAAAEL